MKFGFDIDDTLINLRQHGFTIYNKNLNQTVPLSEFHNIQTVEIHELFGLTAKQGKELWNATMEEIYFTDCPVYENAIEVLTKLKTDGHEIYYITARPKEHGEKTKQWMKDNGFPVGDDKFFYGMQDHEKVHIIEKLQLDYYADDKPAVLTTLTNSKVKLLVKDQMYNRDLEVERITDWQELFSVISKNSRN